MNTRPETASRRGASAILIVAAVAAMTGASFAATVYISPDDIDVWETANPTNTGVERGETANAIDGDTGTFSYMTNSFTGVPITVALDVTIADPYVNGFRISKLGDIDGYSGSGYDGDDDEVVDIPGKEASDLAFYYTTDSGALNTRTWTAVSGLTNGYLGAELMNLIGGGSVSGNTVDGEYHDSATDGTWASLSFAPVAGVTGIAFTMDHDEKHFTEDGSNYYHYGTWEIEAMAIPEPGSSVLAGGAALVMLLRRRRDRA